MAAIMLGLKTHSPQTRQRCPQIFHSLGFRMLFTYGLIGLGLGCCAYLGLQHLLYSHQIPWSRAALPAPLLPWAIIGLGLWVAGLWAIWRIAKSVSDALHTLSTHAQEMAQGNPDFQIPSTQVPEVNALSAAFGQMVDGLKERDRLIFQTAYKDKLTGLDNRAYLDVAMAERMAKAKEPLAVVLWSVDNLDQINEVLGHQVADQVLRRVAQKTLRICRESIVMARIEGNVFCVLVPRAVLYGDLARYSFKRLLRSTVRIAGHQFEVHGRAGIAFYPEHGQSTGMLLRRAEVARQLAKKTHRLAIEFEPRMDNRTANRLELISQLRKAIQDNELELYFQPKMNLRTHSINQAEMLLRWNHPTRGLIAPGGFIELAEQTGLIKDITRFVMAQAFSMTDLCIAQNIRLSMNLSTLDLEDDSLVRYAHQLAVNNPRAPRQIMLEVTESAAMRDPDTALDILRQLTEMGFQVAVDDFGAGYSSLAYLKRFPVTELKIDRALVQGVDSDTDGYIILQSTIEMGHIMGLLVTAEGVETEQEFNTVKALGADYIQGFWLAQPMSFQEFKLKHLLGSRDSLGSLV